MTSLNFASLFPQMPSDEELRAMAATRHAANKAPFEGPDSRAFIGVCLKDWLDVVTAAGVPAIPAEAVASLNRETFLGYERSMEAEPETWDAFNEALAAVPSTHMIRWDACAGLDLKQAMAEKVPFGNSARELHPGDPRAFDILADFPADVFTAWSRPWVQAKMLDGYPVEFRVFIQDSKVIGIANYYPQRALPATHSILGLANKAGELAQQVVAHLTAEDRYPWTAAYSRGFAQGTINATMDFLVTPDDQVLFLEAGPPYGAGAHPCAFIDQPISGIALELAPGVELR